MSEPKQARELAEDLLRRSRKAVDYPNERYALMVLGAAASMLGNPIGRPSCSSATSAERHR